MGRLKSQWIPSVLSLAALTLPTACAAPPQIAKIPQTGWQMPAGQQNLIGATPDVLDAEFGQPTLLRVDGRAQVWLYHSQSCGLNLFLYPDASGVPRVAMATMADGSPAIGDCPADLEQSHIDSMTASPASATLEPPAAS